MKLKCEMKNTLVAPDGGWGWIIVLAYGLNGIMSIPILQTFGLIFKDTFEELKMSATDISIIINANTSCSMLCGLANGVLLKLFGFRKVALAGAFLFSTGIIATSWADSFLYFLLTYGIISSVGMGLVMSAFSLALNTYFKEKRSRAVGFGMTTMGLGPVVMPLVITFLLSIYGPRGTIFILGALSTHSVLSALTLQPVKKHMRTIPSQEECKKVEEVPDNYEESDICLETFQQRRRFTARRRTISNTFGSSLSIDHDTETTSIYGVDMPLPRKTSISVAQSETVRQLQPTYERSKSCEIGSGIDLLGTKTKRSISKTAEEYAETDSESCAERSCLGKCVDLMDLTLLTDIGYLNILIGITLAVFSEMNFSLLTPFILADIGMTNAEIALILSVISITDILFRFLSPFISEKFSITPKSMYLLSLVLLVPTRSSIIFIDHFRAMVIASLFLGIAKGLRTANMTLVIPSYVPLEKLASASGIQLVFNGVVMLLGGPFLGVLRDLTGSYRISIGVINAVTSVTIALWTGQLIQSHCRKRKKPDCVA